ncbi:M20 aminoacylase family protein [Uliginosibacterium sp. 31-16]|uniref:M20 aminoacylase family protein n=1 Tax=Uliginosibacterium sp. 31-16 TaxID=3068315 RepID=UPI00273F69BB|nr:M20 aminoacylase family protein [Uliginosibacterium sp. 31-16]MDP5240323.1 M20 aminoacylase family protein [Uliginosibacterium sp. 31-16]
MPIISEIAARAATLTEIRRDIHAHPELAFEEMRTADLVASLMERWGIEVHRGIGQTGVVGVISKGKSGRVIGLRADMDALPIEEANRFSHRSRHPGCMHACGHDGHTTMLLGAAEYLAEHRNFDGTVVLVFQPAEEGRGGAAAMIADGFFERFPVDAIFGMHNWPGMPVGRFGITPGPVMASADRFDILIKGHGGHAAMPHLTIDPIVAGAALVSALQTIAARSIDPLDGAVVSVTQFHAGEAYNAIPGQALLQGTTRALRPAVREATWARMQQICDGIAAAQGVSIELKRFEGYPPTINTVTEAELCRAVAGELVGVEQVDWALRPSMGAEDFSHFLEHRPGCYVWIGNGPGEGGCTLHNQHYDFNDDNLVLGASYWVRLVEKLLAVG